MELRKPEVASLTKMIDEWVAHPDYELEASFGGPKGLEMTDFLSVIRRLKARFGSDSAALQQEDRLTITLKNHSRFTIVDQGVIQKYCGDNRIVGKPFIAITKDKTGAGSDFNLDEYNVHIKNRREVAMTQDQIQTEVQGWEKKSKAFRLITRWTFEDDDMKFEASVVYSTPKRRIKESGAYDYMWQTRYTDRDIKSNPPQYEIEVELKHSKSNENPTVALQNLIRGVGEVLRGIQKSPVLIRESVKTTVMSEYIELAGVKDSKFKFRGNPPKTLAYENILLPGMQEEEGGKGVSLYSGYNVTDKADGLRVLAFCNAAGELYLIDMSLQVYRTALVNEKCRNCLLDGEWVTMNKKDEPIQQLLLFDVYFINKTDVSQLPFYKEDRDEDTRHTRMTKWVQDWNDGSGPRDLLQKPGSTMPRQGVLKVAVKHFEFATEGNTSIFEKANTILRETDQAIYAYHTDGLIFTPNNRPLPKKAGDTFFEQFKWKPAMDNTIDFLVEAVKEKGTDKEAILDGLKGSDDSVVRYKQFILYVKGISDPILNNPRFSVLNKKGLPPSMTSTARMPVTKIQFDPNEFQDKYAGIANIEVVKDHDFVITENGEPIHSDTIVEMRYDLSETDHAWRWKPLRIRHDKTARYQAAMRQTRGRGIGSRTLNGFDPAMDVWKSIFRPITRSMITSGATEPSPEEIEATVKTGDTSIQRYYQNATALVDKRLIQTMADFHNRYIKERILLQPTVGSSPSRTLVDLAVGQGSDIGRWKRAGVSFVYGIDKSPFGILDTERGAYRRYINQSVTLYKSNIRRREQYDKAVAAGERPEEFKEEFMPPMIFSVGDSTVALADGSSAGTNQEEADIMRALYGNNPRNPIAPLVRDHLGKLKEGADVTTIMFALHYMFESADTFDGLLRNLDASVKVGGYFIGCCFDGERVFNLLRASRVKKGQKLERSIPRKDGVPVKIWSITRKYDNDEFLSSEKDGFGQAIEVDFLSIGASYTEYLVPFELLRTKLATLGMRLLNPTELKALKLNHSTNTFDKSWEMAKNPDGSPMYPMPEQVSEFSFLNRWFIFRRDNKKEVAEGGGVSLSELEQSLTQVGGATEETSGTKKGYEINDLFQFHMEAPLIDRFKLGDKAAARWLAPIARFPIEDGEDTYPSLDHYMAAMRYKYGTTTKDGQPISSEFLQSLFGPEGSIHQRALRAEIRERGDKNLDEDQLKTILKQEYDELQKQVKTTGIKANNLLNNEVGWLEHRDRVLREGLKQRWETDERFRKIVQALHKQNKYLLYYNPSVSMSYYGGMRKANKTIEGDNRVGRMIMDIAGYSA